MFSFLYNTIFLEPVYNLLVAFSSLLPTHDVGLSIILVTIAIRLVTLPLQHRSIVVQRKLKALEPHVQKIRDTHKDDAQAQGMKIMALYKEHGVNPFSGFLTLLIQIPIILALYRVVNDIRIIPELLYYFTPAPDALNTMLFGIIDVSERSLVLALAAGLFQFLQTKYAFPDLPKTDGKDEKEAEPSFQRDFAKSMQTQMKYFLPLFIVVFGATLPAAVSLYWAVNSGLAFAHEVYVKRKADEIK